MVTSMDARWMKSRRHVPINTNYVDERCAPRLAVQLTCDLISHHAERPERHNVSCLSSTGLWIETFQPLHPGAEVVVSFVPPDTDGPELTVFAKVVRVVTGRRRGDRGTIGMGIAFTDLRPHEAEYVNDSLGFAA